VPVKYWRKNHGQAHGDDMGRLAPRKEAAGGCLNKNSSKAESPDSHSTAMLCIAIYWDLWMLISSK